MSDPNHEAQDSVADWANDHPMTKRFIEEQEKEIDGPFSWWVCALLELSVALIFILFVLQFVIYALEWAEAFQW